MSLSTSLETYWKKMKENRHLLSPYQYDTKMIIKLKHTFSYLSLSFSKRYEPIPDPVPPAMEWHITKPYGKETCSVDTFVTFQRLFPQYIIRKAFLSHYL